MVKVIPENQQRTTEQRYSEVIFMYVSGLKPGQRKVLFCCFKRNDKREVKVAQLAGSVAEMSAYHHGEVRTLLDSPYSLFSLYMENLVTLLLFLARHCPIINLKIHLQK